jgi:hypothetical protein
LALEVRCAVAIRAIVARVTERRYIGRDNVAKRVRTFAGSAGRALYRNGSARFELDEAVLTVTPPFGLPHEGDYDVLRVEPLLEALGAEPRVAVVLVRMGGYAVGVFEGERLVASKVGSRFVKGRHKKGGSSSNRFRRRRGEQERELVDAAAAEAARVMRSRPGCAPTWSANSICRSPALTAARRHPPSAGPAARRTQIRRPPSRAAAIHSSP